MYQTQAPEVLACRRYDAKADLWSVGAILWEMVVGAPPYGGANHVALLRSIEAAPPALPPALAATLSPRCVALLTSLLTRDPVARISFPEFFTHPFLAPSTPNNHNSGSKQPAAEAHSARPTGCVAIDRFCDGVACADAALPLQNEQGWVSAACGGAALRVSGRRASAVRAGGGQ